MILYLNKLKSLSWRIFQPLVEKPSNPYSVVSDLFLWRKGTQLKTYFEAYNILPFFEDVNINKNQSTLIVIFDMAGNNIAEYKFQPNEYGRRTIEITDIVPKDCGEYGTFSVFHLPSPLVLSSFGCFLAERGYVGYGYNGSDVRSYVHGNLDALAYSSNNSMEFLGGASFRKRTFNIQHIFSPRDSYELAIVNPTRAMQEIKIYTLTLKADCIDCNYIALPPRGAYLFKPKPPEDQYRILLSSFLVMARPLIFRWQQHNLDVFHA